MFSNLTHLDFLESCFECCRRYATFFSLTLDWRLCLIRYKCPLPFHPIHKRLKNTKNMITNHYKRSVNRISKCNLFVNELTTLLNCSNYSVCIIFQYCWSVFTHAKLMMGVRQLILWRNRWRLRLVAWYCRIVWL